MRIVKLSSLSEKERKKVLEEQEERYQQNQQERQRIQKQANDDFVKSFGNGETNLGHTTTYKDILNSMNSKEAKNDFKKRNNLTLWDQVKNIANGGGFITRKTGTGILGGIVGIGQAGLTDTANQLRKGENDKSTNIPVSALDFISSVLNPSRAMNRAMIEGVKNNFSTITNKDKNVMQKAGELFTNSASAGVNMNQAKATWNTGLQLMGKINNNLDDEVLRVNGKISKPVEELNAKLQEEGKKYDGVTNWLGDAGQTVGNMVPSITASAVTHNPSIGLGVMGISAKGQATQEALNKGADLEQAVKIGDAKMLVEIATEKMAGGIKLLGKGSLDDLADEFIKKGSKSTFGKFLLKQGYNVGGEITEELISDLAGNIIDKGTTEPDKKIVDFKQGLDTAGKTAFTTLVLNGLGGYQQDYNWAKQQTLEQQNQNTDNKVINQEQKTSQNGFSQTETLRQEARNKLESIKQNYDENSYNQMQEFIETAPNEKALNQVISDLNKEAETKQVAPLKQKQEVQLPMKQQETQNKSFEDVAFEAMSNYESNEVESPLKNRDMSTIGKQTKVNAYQYDNPKVKPYFQEMAQQMGEDLAYISSSDNRSTQKGGGTKLSATTKAMDILHNEQGYSYNQIAQGLQNIIDDKGSENNAISKKIELVIDEQLRNGYTNALGKFVEPNQEYINNITEQYSLAEQAPQNNFKYEKTDNQKVNTLYESTSKYFDDSEKTHNMLKPMEKIIRDKGYNITFDDTLDDNVNGRIRTNQETGETEITINPNSNRKGEFIIGHELTHAIETKEMVDLVKSRMEKDGKLRNAVEDLKKLYGTDDINGEVLAEISGQLFGNQEFINNLSVEKPSIFKRIYDTIVSLANKITGNSNEALFLKDLKNKWEKAYRENTNNIKEAQYSFAGEKSLTANINKLNQAKELKDKGLSDQDIYKQTGWYKSVDGKWKYEIDDSDFNIKDVKIEPNETYELNEILDAPELFEAYPKLKNILVSFDDIQNKGEQYSRMGYEYITINNDLINNHSTINDYELLGIKNQSKVYSTLMHEIQHVIQDYEDFAKGSSIEFWSNATKDINRKYEWTQKDYKRYKEEIGLDKYEEKLFKDFRDKKITGAELVKKIDSYIDKKGYTEKFERLSKMQQDLLKKKYKLEDSDASSLYFFTAGEIEAREVQNRIGKDSEWRKQNIPKELAGAVFAEDYTDNPNTRYSLSEDGAMKDNKTGKKVTLQAESMNDGKNLLAIHNLTEDKLKGVLELGGFPVPSIAITNPDIVNHSQFGDISVIFNKNTINPEIDSRNEVYDRDVWSPTFPTIEYDINVKPLSKVRNIVGGYGNEYLSRANSKLNNIEEIINRNGYEGLKEELKDNKDFKYVYYKTLNPDFKIFTKTDTKDVSTRYSNEFLQEFIDEYGKEIPSWGSIEASQRKEIVNKFKEKWIPLLEQRRDAIIEEENKKENPRMFVIGIAKSSVDSNLEWIDSLGGKDKLIEDLNEIQRTGGTKEVNDYQKTNDYINDNINQKDYEKWIDDNFKEIVGKKGIYNGKEYLTSQGNRRTFNQLHEDYNLRNLVKEITKQSTIAGETGFGAGQNFGTLQAKMANKFNSIEDIKNAESKIQYDENSKELMDNYSNKIYDYMNQLREYSYNKDHDYFYGDNAGYALNDFADYKTQNVENLKKALENNGINSKEVPNELLNNVVNTINDLKNIPTDYFEAKPQRAVDFSEIDTVVLPSNTSEDIKQALTDRGIKTIEYDRNNENERADILKSLNEYKFSKTSKSWQDYLEKNYKSEGTTTDLRDIRLPMKEKQEVKAPMKQGNMQQNQNNNTPGENINWNEIERPEENRKFRKHYKSIIESDNTTAEAKAIAKELMKTDTYVPETNKGQLAQADERIMTSSPEAELQSLRSRVLNGERITSVDIAVGERLIQYFSKTGSAEQLQDAIQTTALAGTSTGQTLQALTILNHQTPQGQVTWIQRSIEKINKELAKKKGGTIAKDEDGNLKIVNKQGKDITDKVKLFDLTPEMMNKIMQSENQEQMLKNIDEVYEELGQQVPKDLIEKIDSWRYFSMLANARTHIRNMVGNVAMGKMQRAKDKIAGGIEDVVSKFNPEMERTKTLRRADKKVKEFAKNDFKNVEVQSRLELNESKFKPQSRLQNARRTFKSDVMENTLGRLFDLNDTLLEAEDGLGLKAGYQKALADYLTANKIDVDNITDAQLGKARNYAIQQAKEATFHQANALASWVSQIGSNNWQAPKGKMAKFFVDAVLPFKKTPMNVAKSGVEYSPVGLLKSAIFDTTKLRKGDISVNQYIDNISKGLTGTGIALTGYALAKAGILKASGGDDKDKEKYDEEQGKQSYSIEIGGKTYSLDWLAPTGIPLFVGAETYKLFNQTDTEKSTEKSSEEDKLKQAIKSATNLANAGATAINPMSEMSMISGLTSALSSYNTSDNLGSLGNMMTNMGKSYINQFFPTLMGQVAKTGDEYERTTKSTATGTIGKAVDQTINQIKNKVPGLRQTLPIKTDIWGKEVKQEVNLPLRAINNFINPATVKNVSTDKVDMELNKLYEENHSSSLLPDILTKTVQLNKQTYRLSNKEYAEFTKNYGQTSHKLIENFMKTSDYNKLTQEQKETAISNIYSYAKEQNKMDYAKKVNETVKPSTLYTTMKEIEKNGGKQSEYLSYLAKTKGMSKESEKNKVLADSNYSNKTKEIIYTNGTGKDDNLYNNLLSKSNIDMTEYLNYKDKLSSKAFGADKDKNGKTVAGSAKTKVINYLNNNITGVGNRLLIAGKSYALQNSEKQKLAEYINQIANTKEDRINIYKQLDKNFYVRNEKVYMRVSK